MSGGSLGYAYQKIDVLVEELKLELNERKKDIPDDVYKILEDALCMLMAASGASKDIEWFLSSDTGPDAIRSLHKTWPVYNELEQGL